MTRVETATCQDCGWQGPVEETKEFRNVRSAGRLSVHRSHGRPPP